MSTLFPVRPSMPHNIENTSLTLGGANPILLPEYGPKHVTQFILQHSTVYEQLKRYAEKHQKKIIVNRNGDYGDYELRFESKNYRGFRSSKILIIGINKHLYLRVVSSGEKLLTTLDDFLTEIEAERTGNTQEIPASNVGITEIQVNPISVMSNNIVSHF